MSIAALADLRLQRTENQKPSTTEDAPTTKAGIPAGVLNTLVQWVPTETVTTYVAVQAVIPDLVIPKTQGATAADADYSDRRLLYYVMLGVSVILVPIYAKIKTTSSSTEFKWPVVEVLMSAAAFTLWVIALVDSPFDDFAWFESWMQTLAIVAGGGLLAALALLLKASPDWSDASNNNAPPSPDVTGGRGQPARGAPPVVGQPAGDAG